MAEIASAYFSLFLAFIFFLWRLTTFCAATQSHGARQTPPIPKHSPTPGTHAGA